MDHMINVRHLSGHRYHVRIDRGRTEHDVDASPETLQRVARQGEQPELTIERSFRFLLDREPATAILPRFALEDIAGYFPEYWDEMQG
jgi:hypothetical protein